MEHKLPVGTEKSLRKCQIRFVMNSAEPKATRAAAPYFRPTQ